MQDVHGAATMSIEEDSLSFGKLLATANIPMQIEVGGMVMDNNSELNDLWAEKQKLHSHLHALVE